MIMITTIVDTTLRTLHWLTADTCTMCEIVLWANLHHTLERLTIRVVP